MEGNNAAFVENGSPGIQGGNSVAHQVHILGLIFEPFLESSIKDAIKF